MQFQGAAELLYVSMQKCYGLFGNNAEKIDKCDDDNGDHENVIDTKHFLDAFFKNKEKSFQGEIKSIFRHF